MHALEATPAPSGAPKLAKASHDRRLRRHCRYTPPKHLPSPNQLARTLKLVQSEDAKPPSRQRGRTPWLQRTVRKMEAPLPAMLSPAPSAAGRSNAPLAWARTAGPCTESQARDELAAQWQSALPARHGRMLGGQQVGRWRIAAGRSGRARREVRRRVPGAARTARRESTATACLRRSSRKVCRRARRRFARRPHGWMRLSG